VYALQAALACTIVATLFLLRTMATSTLPGNARHYLCELAMGMDLYILRRSLRRLASWLASR